MRFGRLLSASAAVALAACGGGDNKAASPDTAAAGTATAAAPANSTATANAPAGAAAGAAAGTAMPATGKTVDVKMLGDDKGYRFDPAAITVKAGDAVRWTNVSGGPHNVTVWADSVPAGAAAQLGANMPNTTAALTGPLLATPNATYVVSFAGVKPGVYHYYCTPHLALGMKATVTVQ